MIGHTTAVRITFDIVTRRPQLGPYIVPLLTNGNAAFYLPLLRVNLHDWQNDIQHQPGDDSRADYHCRKKSGLEKARVRSAGELGLAREAITSLLSGMLALLVYAFHQQTTIAQHTALSSPQIRRNARPNRAHLTACSRGL